MNGDQLRALRESRGLTRQELADELRDCSASGIVKWESGVSPVPAWVETKMLQGVRVELPISDLHHLLDYARTNSMDFSSVLSEAVRQYLAAKPSKIKPISYGDPEATRALRAAETAESARGLPASSIDDEFRDLARRHLAAPATSAPQSPPDKLPLRPSLPPRTRGRSKRA